MALKSLIFPDRPSDQIGFQLPEMLMNCGPVVASVVIYPSLHTRVDHLCKVFECSVATQVQPPTSYRSANPLPGLVTDRWAEVYKISSLLILRQSGPKRKPQKIKALVLI